MQESSQANVEKQLLLSFGLEPTKEQNQLINALSRFTTNPTPYLCFVLTGYAGTGKTSILGAYVKTMTFFKIGPREGVFCIKVDGIY